MTSKRLYLLALGAVAVALTAAGSAGGGAAAPQGASISGSISVIGEATGPEITRLQTVFKDFNRLYPDIKVKFTSAARNLPTVLGTAVQGGNPPDLAIIPQPALMREFANRGALKPITFVKSKAARTLSPGWIAIGSVKGKYYGLYIKGTNKSTVWYGVKAFKDAGVKPPMTWPQFLQVAKTLHASGLPAYSIGGADGWTLTDLFENIYIRTAGPRKYDLLATHKIKWTDKSVKTALTTMAQVLADTANIAGGQAGALQTDFATSVAQAFRDNPKAAMVLEADFVPASVSSDWKAVTDYNVFTFPSIGGSPPSVVTAGDALVMFKDNPAARAFVSYMATGRAGSVLVKQGGASSPNKAVPPKAYADPLQRLTATALARAKISRFDLSDLQPSAFGATPGQGMWKLFQDFLKNPSNVNGIAAKMEAAAAKAYKGG
jgi:ABC-type glycerol-3-phosphate transport system substrate-binding protein